MFNNFTIDGFFVHLLAAMIAGGLAAVALTIFYVAKSFEKDNNVDVEVSDDRDLYKRSESPQEHMVM